MEDNLLKTQLCSQGAYNLVVKVKPMHTAKYGNIKQDWQVAASQLALGKLSV